MNPNYNFTSDPFLSDLDNSNVKNFCSWLLNFKPYEMPILAYSVAVILSESFTIQERTVIGSIFSSIATNTFLIAAQQGFLIQVNSLKETNKTNDNINKDLLKRISYIEDVLKNAGLI